MKRRVYAGLRPAAKKAKKSSKKVQRLGYRRPATSMVPRVSNRAGGANNAIVDFIYAGKFTIDPPTLGSPAVQVFSLSSLFDPDVSGVGHQPVGHDEYANLYENYQIISCQIKISFGSNSTTVVYVCGCTVTDQAGTSSDVAVYCENGQTDWGLLTPGGGSKSFTMYIDNAAAHGLTKAQYMSDDVFKGNFGGNPTEQLYLHCWAADSGSGDPSGIPMFAEIRYKAKLTGGKLTALS